MTEKDARAILGKDVAESWLRMPETSRAQLREIFNDDERAAADVLEGKSVPAPMPEPVFAPPQRAEIPEPPAPRVEIALPDFAELLARLEQMRPAPVAPIPLYIPPPDFGVLQPAKPRRVRRCRPVPRHQPNNCVNGCLLAALWLALLWAGLRLALYWFLS